MAGKENGVIYKYYSTTEIKLCYNYFIFNGKKEGEYKSYHWNRQLFVRFNYVNDRIEGENKEYYDNGQIWQILNYKNGKCI